MNRKNISIVLLGVLLVSLLVPVMYADVPDDGSPGWGQTIRLNPTPWGFMILGPRGDKITVHMEYLVAGDAESSLFSPAASYEARGEDAGVQRYYASEFGVDFHVNRHSPDIKFDMVAVEDMTVYVSITDADERFSDLVWREGRIVLDWTDIVGEAGNLVITEDGFTFTMDRGQVIDPLIEYDEVAGTYVYDDIDQYAPFVTVPSGYSDNVSIHAPGDYSLDGIVLQDWMLQTQGAYTVSGDTVTFDFIIENTREETSPHLTDNETNGAGTQWTVYDDDETIWTSGGSADVKENTTLELKGTSCLQINGTAVADTATMARWTPTNPFDSTLYTFVNFWWKGNDTGATISFNLDQGVDRFEYEFTDTGFTWTRHNFALRSPTSQDGTPDPTIIDDIWFQNVNGGVISGIWLVDRLTFDSPMWVPFEIGVGDNTTEITVSSVNSSGLDPLPVFVWDDPNGTTTGDVLVGNVRNLEDEYLGVIAKGDASEWTVKDNATLPAGSLGQYLLNVSSWTLDDVERICIPADYPGDQLRYFNQENSIEVGNPWSPPTAANKYIGYIGETHITSGTSAILHRWDYSNEFVSYELATTILGNYVLDTGADTYSYEFYLDNDREESNATLTDTEVDAGIEFCVYDDNEALWTNAGVGQVTVSEDVAVKETGTSSLNITRIPGAGFDAVAQLDHGAGAKKDYTDYEFIGIWWYGGDTNNLVTYELNDGTNKSRWTFSDDYYGWKRHVFPIDNPDSVSGVIDWSIVQIHKVNVARTNDSLAEWHLDRVVADVGQWVFLEMNVPDDLDSGDNYIINWLSWNGAAYSQFAKTHKTIASSFRVVTNQYYLNGDTASDLGIGTSNAMTLYAEGGRGENPSRSGNAGALNYSDNFGCVNRVGLALYMPPEDSFDSSTDGISQIQIKATFHYGDDGVTTYEFNDDDNQYWGLEHINGSAIVLFDPSPAEPYVVLVTQNDVSALWVIADEDETITGIEFNVTGNYRVYVDEADGDATITAPTGETISELADRWNGYYDNIAYFDRGTRAAVDASGEGDAGFAWTYASVPGLDWKVAGKYPLAPWSNSSVWTASSGRHQARLRASVVMGDPDSYSYTADLNVGSEANYLITLFADFFRDSYNIGPDRHAGDTIPMKNTTLAFTDPRTGTPYSFTYVAQPLQSVAARQDVNRIAVNGVDVDSKVVPVGVVTAGAGPTQNITVYLGVATSPVVQSVADGNFTGAVYSADLEEMVLTMNRSAGQSIVWVDCGTQQGRPTSVSGTSNWSYIAANNTVKLVLTHASPRTVTLVWSAQTWALGNSILGYLVIFAMIPLVIGGKGAQMVMAGELDQDDFNKMVYMIVTVVIMLFVIGLIIRSMAGV